MAGVSKIVVNDLDLAASGVKVNPLEVAARFRSEELARDRDAYARRLLEHRVPRPLHFVIDRPNALNRLLRVIPRWRPQMTFVECRNGMDGGRLSTMTADAARQFARNWIAGIREQGADTYLHGGLVFTYTDIVGLPAEIYGGE